MKASGHLIRLSQAILVAFVVMALFCCSAQKGTKIEKRIIKSNTTWSNEILINGDVEIAKGATLTIMPGTVVRFAKIEADGPANLYEKNVAYNFAFSRAELIIRGRLLARGTKDRMILFTSAESSPKPGDWGAINFQDSSDNILGYCEVSYANTGIHGHGVQATVENCYLHDNGVGVGFKDVKEYQTRGSMNIFNNRITGNGAGILCGRGTRVTISHNTISKNKFYGIFGKMAYPSHITYNNVTHNGKGVILYATQGFRLSQNNIADNEAYNVSMLEGQIWNADARYNWWGTRNKRKIKKLIWDKDEDKTLGVVDFSNFSASPIEGAGVLG